MMNSASCASAQSVEILSETTPMPQREPEIISIGILLNQETVRLKSSTAEGLIAVNADGVSYILPENEISFSLGLGSIQMQNGNQNSLANSRTWIVESYGGESIYVNGKSYRGKIRIEKLKDSSVFNVINLLDIEEYLRGVVPREIGFIRIENIEAIKAQAVAARTYAIRNIGKRKALGFDLFATSDDQNYGGVEAENWISDSAVKVTEGEILVWNDEVIDAFYHSTCGGRTASSKDVWGVEKPYLLGVDDSLNDTAACIQSRYFTWTEKYSDSKLIELAGNASRIGIGLLEKDLSGRNKLIEIVKDSVSQKISGDEIRRVLKRNDGGMLRSTIFEVIPETGAIKLIGRGWGHGIGMCQMGAIARAKAGWKYNEILLHYYSEAKLIRLRGSI